MFLHDVVAWRVVIYIRSPNYIIIDTSTLACSLKLNVASLKHRQLAFTVIPQVHKHSLRNSYCSLYAIIHDSIEEHLWSTPTTYYWIVQPTHCWLYSWTLQHINKANNIDWELSTQEVSVIEFFCASQTFGYGLVFYDVYSRVGVRRVCLWNSSQQERGLMICTGGVLQMDWWLELMASTSSTLWGGRGLEFYRMIWLHIGGHAKYITY